MRSWARNVIRALDWAADWRDRVGIVTLLGGAASWASLLTIQSLGVWWGIAVGVTFMLSVFGAVLVFGPRTRSAGGTLIPHGWAAIVTGAPDFSKGEWVPPGYTVSMDPAQIADDFGNSASGPNARVYFAAGGSAIAGGRVGLPLWPTPRGVSTSG